MAKKITELTELTSVATNDLFVVEDVSTSTTKKITWDNLVEDGFITPAKLTAGTGTTWAYDSFTPTVTLTGGSAANGNAVITGGRKQVGKTAHFWEKYVIGNTTTFTGLTQIKTSLPFTASSAFDAPSEGAFITGVAVVNGSYYPILCLGINTTTIQLVCINAAGTYAVFADLAATAPGSWTVGDGWFISGKYEVA